MDAFKIMMEVMIKKMYKHVGDWRDEMCVTPDYKLGEMFIDEYASSMAKYLLFVIDDKTSDKFHHEANKLEAVIFFNVFLKNIPPNLLSIKPEVPGHVIWGTKVKISLTLVNEFMNLYEQCFKEKFVFSKETTEIPKDEFINSTLIKIFDIE